MRYESNECGQFHSSFSPPHSSSSPRACLHTCSTRPLLLDDDIWTDGANSIPRPAKRSLPTSALAVLLLRGCFCYLLAYDKRHSLRREAGPTPLCRRSIGTVHCGTRDNQCFVKLNFAILAPGLTWFCRVDELQRIRTGVPDTRRTRSSTFAGPTTFNQGVGKMSQLCRLKLLSNIPNPVGNVTPTTWSTPLQRACGDLTKPQPKNKPRQVTFRLKLAHCSL